MDVFEKKHPFKCSRSFFQGVPHENSLAPGVLPKGLRCNFICYRLEDLIVSEKRYKPEQRDSLLTKSAVKPCPLGRGCKAQKMAK